MCFVPRWCEEIQCSIGFLLCSVHIQPGAIMRLGASLVALQQHPWNSHLWGWGISLAALQQHLRNSLVLYFCLFSHGRVRSPHTLQNDFTFINCLSTGLQLDSAIGLVLYLLLTGLISRQVWTSTSIQLLTPLLMPLIQSHKREWRRQEKPQWCMDTWRCHFFPISNWQGSVILQGRFLPAPLHNNYSGR